METADELRRNLVQKHKEVRSVSWEPQNSILNRQPCP